MGWASTMLISAPITQLEAGLLGSDVSADCACQAIPIGDSHAGIAQDGRLLNELIGVRGPFQEREVGLAMKLDITDQRRLHGMKIPRQVRHVKFRGRLFGHGESIEETVEEPSAVAPVAIDPNVRAVFPFGAVIVAFDVLSAPPTRCDPLRPPGADDTTALPVPHHPQRRTIGDNRSHINRLRYFKESERPRPRLFLRYIEHVSFIRGRGRPRNQPDRVLGLCVGNNLGAQNGRGIEAAAESIDQAVESARRALAGIVAEPGTLSLL